MTNLKVIEFIGQFFIISHSEDYYDVIIGKIVDCHATILDAIIIIIYKQMVIKLSR